MSSLALMLSLNRPPEFFFAEIDLPTYPMNHLPGVPLTKIINFGGLILQVLSDLLAVDPPTSSGAINSTACRASPST